MNTAPSGRSASRPGRRRSACSARIRRSPSASAKELYAALAKAGVETIIDDRAVSAGVVFSEADLIGAPIRLTVSPRNLADGMIELTTRDKRVKKQVPVCEALSTVLALKAQLFAEINRSVTLPHRVDLQKKYKQTAPRESLAAFCGSFVMLFQSLNRLFLFDGASLA